MKRNLLRLAFLTSAAGLALAAGSCGAQKDHHHPGHGGQPETPTTGAKPTDGPTTGTTNQQADGSITSGGGYVYGYQANPWFIGNTAIVKYCVDMDEDNFGVSRETAEKTIEAAIGNWQDALKNASFRHVNEEPVGTLVLGTQDFVKSNCGADGIDIRFQLGKLSAAQSAQLGNPVKFVASTVQTTYDEENMRGSGFIYVAPERGPLKPDADDIAQTFWSTFESVNLELALSHELGHVFGLPHRENTIMAQTLCEEIVTNRNARGLENLKSVISRPDFGGSFHGFVSLFLKSEFVHKNGTMFISADTIKNVLGLSTVLTPEEREGQIVLEGNKITVYAITRSTNPPYMDTLKRELSKFELAAAGSSSTNFTSIRIPRKQKIMRIPADEFDYQDYPGGSYQSLGIIQRSNVSVSGYIIDPTTNNRTYVTIKTDPESQAFDGDLFGEAVVDGRIVQLY